jgi:hypothetical protein
MKGKKLVYLFLALLLPGCIFVFLKFFGKNEFAVQPLYESVAPISRHECHPVTLPYHVPDSIGRTINNTNDSLVMVIFGDISAEGKSQLNRVHEELAGASLQLYQVRINDPRSPYWKSCIFFLREPFNLILVDNHKRIRGEYNINDREDVDRLLTEITIILRKF